MDFCHIDQRVSCYDTVRLQWRARATGLADKLWIEPVSGAIVI